MTADDVRHLHRPDGVVLPYRVLGDGSGPRLLFAHALTAPGLRADEFFVPLLGRGWTVATLDQRNHGEASFVTDPVLLRLAAFGDDLVAVLDDLGWDRVWWCGGSMGAATVLAATEAVPERVAGMALIAPAVGPELNAGRDDFLAIAAAFRTGGADAGIARWRGQLTARGADTAALDQRAGMLRARDPTATACLLEAVMGWTAGSAIDAVRQLTVPVLVLGWTGDDIHPWSLAEQIAATAPQGRVHRLWEADDSGGPELMSEALADMLTDALVQAP